MPLALLHITHRAPQTLMLPPDSAHPSLTAWAVTKASYPLLAYAMDYLTAIHALSTTQSCLHPNANLRSMTDSGLQSISGPPPKPLPTSHLPKSTNTP